MVYGDAEGDLVHLLMAATSGASPFQWKGKTDHETLMQKLAGAQLLLNSSTQEGGANAVCEAISLGLPVVASDIPGNIGMLGDGYAGYFSSGNTQSLANLLQRCASDPDFYALIRGQVQERRKLFAYSEESLQWLTLMKKIGLTERSDNVD